MANDHSDAGLAPGSNEARAAGCKCDARLNRGGAGAGKNQRDEVLFVPAITCPLHGEKKKKKEAKTS